MDTKEKIESFYKRIDTAMEIMFNARREAWDIIADGNEEIGWAMRQIATEIIWGMTNIECYKEQRLLEEERARA